MLPQDQSAVSDVYFPTSENEKIECDKVDAKWRPAYLRRRILFVFILIFCITIATLEALRQTSKTNTGLATSTESLHYTWTYGPTAILTIVSALWSRVEFQTKQNAPWQEMLSKPRVNAKKSVLLDYVSMMQPVAMVKALRNGHYLVAASVTSSLIFRLLIIFSTGLFSLQPTPMDKGQVQVRLSTSIDAFNASTKLKAASAKSYDNLNAIIYQNSRYADGTNARIAYQTASSAGLPSDAFINTTVLGIAPDLHCEIASFNSANFSTYGEGIVSTPSCNMTINFNHIWNNNDLRLITQVGSLKKCSGSKDANDQRIPIFIGTTFFSTNHSGIGNNPPLLNLSLSHSVQHICKPVYAVQNISAFLNTTESFSMTLGQEIGSASALKNLTASDIASQAFSYTDTYLKAPTPADNDELFSGKNISMDLSLTLGARLSDFQGNAQDIYDQNMTVPLFSTFYRAITAQVVSEALFQPGRSTIAGQATVTENRLLVTEGSFYAMEICLAMLVLLTGVMIYLKADQAITPWNPNTIMAIATTLSNNPSFCEVIKGTGATSEERLDSHLSGQEFTTRTVKGKIEVDVEGDKHLEQSSTSESVGHWKPFPGFLSRIGFFIILAGVIASLEAVLHVSQKKNGLGNVSDSASAHYTWTLLPALVMVSISLFFGSIDFNVRSLAPYARLKNNSGMDWQYFKRYHFMDALSLGNLINSFRFKEFAVFATTLATIIGSILTIVSSGLYSAFDTSAISKVNFTQVSLPIDPLVFSRELSTMNQANLTTEIQNIKYGVSGMQTASEILNNNLSFPQWTWNEFAFPNLTLPIELVAGNTTGLFVDIVVPALRSSLSCQLRNSSELPHNFTPMSITTTSPYAGPKVTVNTTILPCSQNATLGSRTTEIRGASMNTAVEGKYLPVGYFGSTLQNICYLNGSSLQATYTRNNAYNFNQNQVTYIWGETTANALNNLFELSCMDSPETVQAKIRLKLPDLTLDEDHPPTAIEETAKRANNALLPLSDAWYYLQSYDEGATGMNSFFQTLVSGKYAIPQEYLSDTSRAQAVVEAIKHQHKIIRAQQFGLDAQNSVKSESENDYLIGNLTNPTHRRLFQDAASTRILEALLAVMLILGVLSSILLNTDDVLPKNPNSIASLASLLTNSNFLEFFQHVPDPTDKTIGNTVFSKSRFYLGWLDNQNDPDPGFVKGGFWSSNKASVSGDSKFTIYVDDYEGKPI